MTNGLPNAPDVPAGGLLVESGPPGGAPSAFAALLYELDPDTSAQTLTLNIAPNSVTTASSKLELCPLLEAINHPEDGGPTTDAPPYNCAKKVTAAPTANGRQYQFPVADLASDKLLAVAILPADTVDRVVFSPPDPNSLSTQPAPPGAPPAGVTGPTTAPVDATAAVPAQAPSSLSLFAPPSSPNAALPSAGAGGSSVAPPPVASSPAAPGTAGFFLPPLSGKPKPATPFLVALLVAAALGGAALWLYAGRPRRAAVAAAS